ncbi:hypothetical protein HAX54_010645 [Datura stramonium]|uniref:Uncharacterized protein n=1 Tax=Datura stramonium TaxID=4076 RepID=A0ABS8TI65_DATST|nr:hypothetical protein [Datura stramonium]
MKLKGIDRGPHKRWSMWFNSMQSEEPTVWLDMPRILLKERGAFGNADTGGAWLSSAHAIRCWVKSRNECNPRSLVSIVEFETLTASRDKPEEGEDDVKSSCPLCPGDTLATMAGTKGRDPAATLRFPSNEACKGATTKKFRELRRKLRAHIGHGLGKGIELCEIASPIVPQ